MEEKVFGVVVRAIRTNVIPGPGIKVQSLEINLDTPLSDLGLMDDERWDKSFSWLNLIEVIFEIESQLKVVIHDWELFLFKTVKDIFACVMQKLKLAA